jgi:hypothetical protein
MIFDLNKWGRTSPRIFSTRLGTHSGPGAFYVVTINIIVRVSCSVNGGYLIGWGTCDLVCPRCLCF